MRPLLCAALTAAALAIASQAGAAIYRASLDGASEEPPNDSLGTGTSTVRLDLVAHTLRVTFSFANLTGNTTAAHIHGPTGVPGEGTAGVMTAVPTFPDTPLGVTSGSYDMTFDTLLASTYNPAFVTAAGGTVAAAEEALAAALAGGQAYLNIHTEFRTGGEIRGFYSEIPLPAALGPLLFGLLALGAVARRRGRPL